MQHHETDSKQSDEDEMSNEEEVSQVNSKHLTPGAPVANNPELNENSNQVDQEMADAYGWTPQQAKESTLYL